MLTTLLAATLYTQPTALAPSDRQCRTALARAIAFEMRSVVPAFCWRIGPVALGMEETEIERRIGRPIATGNAGARARYRATLYAFPTRPRRGDRVAIRLAELRYERGRLAAIDTSPGARIDSTPCGSRPGRVGDIPVQVDAPAGPLLRFAGVGVGDLTALLAHRFGKAHAANASRDWLNYLPVPISFDVDPDRRRINGIAIATDDEALTSSAFPRLMLRPDPATCRLVSVGYSLGDS